MVVDNLEGTMMEGVDVEVRWKEVVRAVVEIAGGAVKKGTRFIQGHPKETRIALAAAVGAIAMLAPEVVKAQGPTAPPTPIPRLSFGEIRGAVNILTDGKEPATTVLTGLSKVFDEGVKTSAECA